MCVLLCGNLTWGAAGIVDGEQVPQQRFRELVFRPFSQCALMHTCRHVWPLCVSLCVHMATNVSMCAH